MVPYQEKFRSIIKIDTFEQILIKKLFIYPKNKKI